MIAVQLLTSAWSWFSSNTSTCAQSNVKDPQGSSGNSSTDTAKGQSLAVQLFEQSVHVVLTLVGDKLVWKTFKACQVIENSATEKCREFALNFFAVQFIQDSTLLTNEKKWPEIFSKIEGIVSKAYDDIVACYEHVGQGYCVRAGMPLSLAKQKGGSPILFLDVKENADSLEGEFYTGGLGDVDPERICNFTRMENLNCLLAETIVSNGISYQFPDRAVEFIYENVDRISLEINEK